MLNGVYKFLEKEGEVIVRVFFETSVHVFANLAAYAIYDIYIGPRIARYQEKHDYETRRRIGF